MIDDKAMVEFLTKLKKVRGDQFASIKELIWDAWSCDGVDGNPDEIAKTILEIIEPERIGKLKFWKGDNLK